MLLAAAIILAPAAGGLLVVFWLLVRRLRAPKPVLLVPTHVDAWPPLPTAPQLPPGPPPPFLLPPVRAIEKRAPDIERGDLVDMEGCPHVGVVICVDGDTAWCRLVKSGTRHSSGLTSYEFKGQTVWPWPVAQCSVMDRSLVGFAVDN